MGAGLECEAFSLNTEGSFPGKALPSEVALPSTSRRHCMHRHAAHLGPEAFPSKTRERRE